VQELQQLNEFFKKTSLGKVADEHRLHLQMVALETRIRNDDDLHALKATALKVPTDLERRHWLKRYYELYFKKLHALASDEVATPVELTPAVPIRRSVTDDYIVCLEDGKKLKMLKRHLRTAYGLTPEQYREKWGLPADYPMVAPNYAKKRSSLARQIGLGTGGRKR
jgi:hypothetical protein